MRHLIMFLIFTGLSTAPISPVEAQRRTRPVRATPSKASQPNQIRILSIREAFDIVTTANDKDELIPHRLMDMGLRYTRLNPENCFGFTLPNGKRLAAESRGEGYGMSLDNSSLIGFIYSEGDFAIEGKSLTKWAGKPFPRGGYAVFASADQLKVFGESATDYFEMTSKLDPKLVDEKSNRRPRFSFAQDRQGMWLVLEGNRFLTKAQQAGTATVEANASFLVAGVLLAKDGSPLAGNAVYIFPLRFNGNPFAYYSPDKEGVIKLDNPHATTDSQGRFTIRMSNEFSIDNYKVTEFTVGLDRDKLLGQNGSTVRAKFDERTKKVELGKLVVQ